MVLILHNVWTSDLCCQEILSELIEIDLVVNFKCTEHCLAEHERGSI